jgi:hypothetical protein
MKSSCTRKDSPAVKVYCLPDERTQLQANASVARVGVSNYMLHVGLGYGVRGAQDRRYVADLIRVGGDLGRLGGLFKLWLTNDERTEMVGESRLRAVLGKIEATQDELRAVIRKLVLPHTVHQEL